MHEYDSTLKLLLERLAPESLREVTGVEVTAWLNAELPELGDRQVDLLGETAAGELIHIELQSTNDNAMAPRMAEYCLRIYRKYQRFPRQTVLYVGKEKPRMAAELAGAQASFRYDLVDIREIEAGRLLASDRVGDNVIAILTRLQSPELYVRRTVEKLAGLEEDARAFYIQALFELASLRDLEELVETEVRKMPVVLNVLDNKVLGREYKRGLEEGLQKGLEQGLQRGELAVLRRQIEARFGPLPAWVDERLAKRSTEEIEDLAVRFLKAESLEELLA